MALNAPPPYEDITGISRVVMKDNAQETIANYNGNARPGEIVVNLEVDPPTVFVGNNAGFLTQIGTGGGGGDYSNANVVALGNLGWPGNIIPSANAVYSLGNVTNQWGELWVSGNTVYINSVPISVTGNTLTVNGEAVLGNSSNVTITTTGTITANAFVGDGSQLTGITANTGDITFTNATISAPDDANIIVQAVDTDSVVRSRLRLEPDLGRAIIDALSAEDTESFNTGNWGTAVWETAGGGGTITITNATDIYNFINDDLDSALDVVNRVNGVAFDINSTSFDFGTGTLSLGTTPGPAVSPTTVTDLEFSYRNRSRIGIDYDDNTLYLTARGSMDIDLISDRDIVLVAGDDVRIEGEDSFRLINNSTTEPIRIITNDDDTSRTWSFGADGRLILPESSEANVAKLTSPPNDADVSLQLYSANAVRIVTNTAGEPSVWTFGTTGTFTAAGDIATPTGNVSAGNVLTTTISNADNVLISSNGNVEILADSEGGAWGILFGADGEIFVNAANLATIGGGNFYSDGAVTAVGNITGGNLQAVGNLIVIGGISTTGASPAPSLSGFDAVSAVELNASGNVSIGGILEVTGNITGAAVTGTNNMQLPVYADATARDTAILSPQPGMMVYVTGTGMQVRGATQWNTVTGSGT